MSPCCLTDRFGVVGDGTDKHDEELVVFFAAGVDFNKLLDLFFVFAQVDPINGFLRGCF